MTKQISFETFLEELSVKTALSPERLKPLVFDLFVHIRANTECGLWVEAENFGSFHPLWYEIKKHKERKEDIRIREELEAEKKREQERLKQEAKEAEELRVKEEAEKERLEAERIEKEKKEAEKVREEEQRREKERLEQETKEAEELRVKEKAEKERLEAERIEKERKEAEKAQEEEQRREKKRLEQEAKEAEALRLQEEQEALAQLEIERVEKEKEEAERVRKEELEAEKKREEEHLAEQAEIAKVLEAERLEAIRVQEALVAEEQRLKEEQEEAQRLEAEKVKKEAEEKKRVQQEELAAEKKREEERLAQEAQKAEALRLQKEKEEAERLEKERLEKEAAEVQKLRQEEIAKEEGVEEEKRREEAFAAGSHNLLRIEQEPLKKRDKRLLPYSLVLLVVAMFAFWMMQDEAKVEPLVKKDTLEKQVEKVVYESFSKLEKTKETTSEKFYKYTLESGDSLYGISKRIYGDSKFWPLIYVYNKDQIKDVDKVCPGDILKLSRIPQGSSAQEALSKVYIQAYKAYKYVGKHNKAHWLLYWGSRNIDMDLIHKFSEDIDPEDKKRVEAYLKRFNTL